MILLHNRAVIRISGEDKSDFLQGLITNDINKPKPIYAALLTPQGKYLFDFIIYEDYDSFLLDCEAARKGELIKKLSMYKLRAKVEIEDLPNWKVYSGDGVDDPRNAKLGKRLVAESSYDEGDFAEYEKIRILLGVPDSADFIPEKSFIQQYRFDELNGIDYEKGCYVGQEVIARTHYKGTIRKTIFKLEGDLPNFGEDIMHDGKKIGLMLNSSENLGLALCDIESVEKFGKDLKFKIERISS